MIFKKKKDMVDVRELQRRGVVRLPKKDIVIPTDNNGFVELGNTNQQTQTKSNTEFFGFSNSTNASSNSGRDESQRITDLDNKIYKLEQRIELLERKLGVTQDQNSSGSLIGW